MVVDYLDAKYGKGNGLTPSDPQQAAEVCCPLLGHGLEPLHYCVAMCIRNDGACKGYL